MDISETTFNYIHALHRHFIDSMHLNFGVQDPPYVDQEDFLLMLVAPANIEDDELGVYGIRPPFGIPFIMISPAYSGYSERDKKDYFGKLSLETTIFHESSHHLHHTYHNRIFNDSFTWELVINSAVVYYFHMNGMQEHLENLSIESEVVAKELYGKLGKESELRSLLTASEKKAFRICSRILGKEHPHLIEREKQLRELKEGN